ncbi:MAG: S8 family serine peptidase [Chloroflexota bacterium]
MKRSWPLVLVAISALLASVTQAAPANAAHLTQETAAVYTWWLARWEDRALLCSIGVTHDGIPTADEIEAQCGHGLRTQWEATPPCTSGTGEGCTGLFLTLASTRDPDTATPPLDTSTPGTSSPAALTPEAATLAPPTSTPTATLVAPSVREVPWLSRPSTAEELFTNQPLVFLAGHLIANGLADADECPGHGLMENGAANPCGLEQARYQVYLWQNRFDTQILEAAEATDVPPFLLKGVFMQETQFWPSMTRNGDWDFGEYGLGQLNDLGTDALLAWNPSFYNDFCPTVLAAETCSEEYISLSSQERALLRGSVINLVRVDCPTCAQGIDLAKAESSVMVFAETLKANHEQVRQVIRNAAGWYGAFAVSGDDTWRFTLVNYHAGPGCLFSALGAARLASEKLNWGNVSEQLEPGCEGAIDYVEIISTVYVTDPLPTPTAIYSSATPTASLTETPGSTPSPTVTGTLTLSDTATATEDLLIPTGTVSETATSLLDTPTPDTLTPDTSTPGTLTPTSTVVPSPTVILTSTPVEIQSPYEAGEIIVQMESGSRSDIEALIESLPMAAQVREPLPELNAVVVEVAASDLSAALVQLQDHPEVASAEPNYVAQAAFIVNDPGYYQQENLALIQVPMAWDLARSSKEVIVAVVDTGVDTTHPDLVDHLWQNKSEANGSAGVDDDNNGYVDDVWGWNMVEGNNHVRDDHGHGTHVSGIIGAVADNGMGVAGIAPNARILTVKALDAQGFGSYSQIAEAIVYATSQGARIINLGLGGEGNSQVLHDAIDYALGHGVIVVAAAGNTGADLPIYPAAYAGVLSVGALDNGLTWATFSSFGSNTTLSAPGIDIYSTYPGGSYSQMSGTSMASAEVSGIAAMLAGQDQFVIPAHIRDALISVSFDLGAPGWDPFYGFGIVHALDSLQYSTEGMPSVIWPMPGPLPTPVTEGGAWAMASQTLWGAAQTCSYPFIDATNSIDFAFNGVLASCTGGFGNSGDWTYTGLQSTTLTSVASASLEVRFYVSGWEDDWIDLEANNGSSWTRIARFEPGSPPPINLTTLTYNVSGTFTSPSEANNARLRLRGTQVNGLADTITIFLDEVRLTVSDTAPTPTPLAAQPTPTLPSRAPTAIPAANDPHVSYTANTGDCAACHRSHTSRDVFLRLSSPEERVCFTCHTSGGIGTDVQAAFTNQTNTSTRFFEHDIAAANGIHRLEENTPGVFSGTNRHIECEDCHEPHKPTRDAVSDTTLPPAIQPEMFSASGVNPMWSGPGAPSGFFWMDQAQREYQVCFKCHSSFTTLPAYLPEGWDGSTYVADGLQKLTAADPDQVLDSRNLAQEFNPNHASFHPVIAAGRNIQMPAGGFVPGWSTSSMVYCTDCHSNASQPINGYGPHGSARLHILLGSDNYSTVDSGGANPLGTDEICFRCHRNTTYAPSSNVNSVNTNFHNGTTNLHETHSGTNSERVPCYVCHDSHGSEQAHLINFDTSAVTINSGYTSQSAWAWNGTSGTCYVSCHSESHGPGKSYTP